MNHPSKDDGFVAKTRELLTEAGLGWTEVELDNTHGMVWYEPEITALKAPGYVALLCGEQFGTPLGFFSEQDGAVAALRKADAQITTAKLTGEGPIAEAAEAIRAAFEKRKEEDDSGD